MNLSQGFYRDLLYAFNWWYNSLSMKPAAKNAFHRLFLNSEGRAYLLTQGFISVRIILHFFTYNIIFSDFLEWIARHIEFVLHARCVVDSELPLSTMPFQLSEHRITKIINSYNNSERESSSFLVSRGN